MTPAPTLSAHSVQTLSGSAIAGIVVGVIVGLITFTGLLLYVYCAGRKSRTSDAQELYEKPELEAQSVPWWRRWVPSVPKALAELPAREELLEQLYLEISLILFTCK